MTPAEWLEARFHTERLSRPKLGGAGRLMLTLKDDTTLMEQLSSAARWPRPYPQHRINRPEKPA